MRVRRHPSPGVAGGLVVVLLVAAGCGGTIVQATPARTPASVNAPRPTAAPEPVPPSPNLAIDREPVRTAWTRQIDEAVGTSDVSVAVGIGDRLVYLHRGDIARIPASNEKLLTTAVALDTWGASHRFPTSAEAERAPRDGVLRGDLWLIGSGDPELTSEDLSALASTLSGAGLREVTGSVLGDTATFDRGWWAPGWVPGLSRRFVTRTTALAFDGNRAAGLPEQIAATALSSALERLGVVVRGAPRTGDAPEETRRLAAVRSATLAEILARQNADSINFDAETLTKALGFEAVGEGASTADGAAAIASWAVERGIEARVRDGSGLSHRNRVSVAELVTVLLLARHAPWFAAFERSLPDPGEGTLDRRLLGVPVRAKTGTLFETPVSALSGYVRSASGRLIAFSLISRGLAKPTAVGIEDAIVRTLASV